MPTWYKGEEGETRRGFLKATGGAATAVALAGCGGGGTDTPTESDGGGGGSDDTETESDTDGDGGGGANELNLINGTMDSMDPVEYTLANAGEMVAQMYDAPIYNPEGTLAIESLVATDWSVSDDGTVYTFDLKEGVSYHGDWGEVTAQDFVYSWERLAASDNSRRTYVILSDLGVAHETTENDEGNEVYEPGTMGVEAVDDYTLEVTLEEPYFDALGVISSDRFASIPEGIIGDIEGYDGEVEHAEFASSAPVGSGPFQFEMWESDQQASVTAFDDYHGEGPMVDRVHWQIMEDSNAIYNYGMNQNVDAFVIPTSQYDRNLVEVENTDDRGRMTGTYGPVRNGETMQYNAAPGLGANFIGFNCLNVIKPARIATAKVMNHELIANSVYKGRDVPGYHMTPPAAFPGGPDGYDEHAANYPHGYEETQIQQARSIMEEAGYSDDDPYEFSFTITASATSEQLAQQIRDKLASAHISMEITTAPFATMIDRRKQGQLDAFLSGWGMGRNDPSSILALLYPPNTDLQNSGSVIEVNWVDRGNGTGANSQAAEAWEVINNHPRDTEEHAQERADAYIQMEEAMWEDVPFIAFGHDTYQRFTYQWADIPPFGPTGSQRYNTVEIDTDAKPS
ncbi:MULTISPECIES: ABC transporter substrate-binding protein [Halolamina]|uniref:Peptide/nickel transport system substrate-binding protein n=1 Tax=Halolamina pelagica TaxID=699431 RepID=A0A1I5VX16_9EURY|nr:MULTISPECIES: ABC transporter substrate-binding protein [Halolamina]NHX37531.1 ABC transporter substrate-binding protein [Halolamina sp. R1-12]SFQ11991.1 peptide/nickel transport system substrate-binding protein [Halolamina pelagica]